MELNILEDDEAFYYSYDKKGNLEELISSHIDDFMLAGKEGFLMEITEIVKDKLDISK